MSYKFAPLPTDITESLTLFFFGLVPVLFVSLSLSRIFSTQKHLDLLPSIPSLITPHSFLPINFITPPSHLLTHTHTPALLFALFEVISTCVCLLPIHLFSEIALL